jgi:hypothetical protein
MQDLFYEKGDEVIHEGVLKFFKITVFNLSCFQ